MKPICVDLECGLGGWAEGFLAEDFEVIGFDIERHDYGTGCYPGQLILQDVRTITGAQFLPIIDRIACFVASPPCTEYSYMAMPWKRAKQIERALMGKGHFPKGYKGSRTITQLNELFDASFRIQREACEAAGRYIPLVVENVRGAQKWVGRAAWNFGSFYLWGDVPALMPLVRRSKLKTLGPVTPHQAERHNCHINEMRDAVKIFGQDWSEFKRTGKVSAHWRMQLLEQRGEAAKGEACSMPRRFSSHSKARKAASAQIAKIPFPLAQHIARSFANV